MRDWNRREKDTEQAGTLGHAGSKGELCKALKRSVETVKYLGTFHKRSDMV